MYGANISHVLKNWRTASLLYCLEPSRKLVN